MGWDWNGMVIIGRRSSVLIKKIARLSLSEMSVSEFMNIVI